MDCGLIVDWCVQFERSVLKKTTCIHRPQNSQLLLSLLEASNGSIVNSLWSRKTIPHLLLTSSTTGWTHSVSYLFALLSPSSVHKSPLHGQASLPSAFQSQRKQQQYLNSNGRLKETIKETLCANIWQSSSPRLTSSLLLVAAAVIIAFICLTLLVQSWSTFSL